MGTILVSDTMLLFAPPVGAEYFSFYRFLSFPKRSNMADGDEQKQSNHLSFNLQEFLGDNSASDASFQSMVQNMSGQDGLPAELQQLLGGSNGTDDLVSVIYLSKCFLFPLTRPVKNLLGQGNTSGGGTTSQPISPATTPQHAMQQTPTGSNSGGAGVPWVMPTSGAMPSNVHVMSMSMPSSQQTTPSPITSTAGNSVPVQSQAGKCFCFIHTFGY